MAKNSIPSHVGFIPDGNRRWAMDHGLPKEALFSRRVVGWSMSAGMTAQLVTDALVMAIWRRGKPDALLHHSDRGSQTAANSSSG